MSIISSVFDLYLRDTPLYVSDTKREKLEKMCTKCKKVLPMALFTVYKKKDGYYPKPRCKACLLEDKREWRAKNKGNKGVVK